MPAQFQVVSEAVQATVNTVYGRSVQILYKGALVSPDAPELERLINEGYVAKVDGDDETGGVNADGVPAAAFDAKVPVAVTTTPVEASEEAKKVTEQAKADNELAARRAEAVAKLPADGTAPKGTAGKDVLVEYLVTKGYSYDELAKLDKPELTDMVKALPS